MTPLQSYYKKAMAAHRAAQSAFVSIYTLYMYSLDIGTGVAFAFALHNDAGCGPCVGGRCSSPVPITAVAVALLGVASTDAWCALLLLLRQLPLLHAPLWHLPLLHAPL